MRTLPGSEIIGSAELRRREHKKKRKKERKKRTSRAVIFTRSRFARSTIPEEKWGTTRSLNYNSS